VSLWRALNSPLFRPKSASGVAISAHFQFETGGLATPEKLELCVRHICRSEGVPPFCDHANEILVRTLDLDGGSSKKLVQVILQDMGLASHVLRLANSASNNHSGRPIASVAHAVTVLGWLEVRSLASTLRYIEHFAHRSPALRELALASVLTAIQSREVAAAVAYAQPEVAYICGLFRNLGEVLIACYRPEDYSRIIILLDEEHIPERAACLRVLDFPWDEVGRRVANHWRLPPALHLAMDASSTSLAPLDRSLASISNYAHHLTHTLYRQGAALDAMHLEAVLSPAGQPVLISLQALNAIVDGALAETREMFSALHIPTETLRISKQAARARKSLESC
jgi:HD-like signal output (HDOD) protein